MEVKLKDGKLDLQEDEPTVTRRKYLSHKWSVPEKEIETYFPKLKDELDTPVFVMTSTTIPNSAAGVTAERMNDPKFMHVLIKPEALRPRYGGTPKGKVGISNTPYHEMGHVLDATRQENIGGYDNAPIGSTPAKDDYFAREKEVRGGFEAFTENLLDNDIRLTNEKSPLEFLKFLKETTHLMDPYTRENVDKILQEEEPRGTEMFKVLYDSYKRTTPSK